MNLCIKGFLVKLKVIFVYRGNELWIKDFFNIKRELLWFVVFIILWIIEVI